MSRGTAEKGVCTSSGGQGGRRRSGTSTSCEPATGPRAAAMVKPGQVRCGHCSDPGLGAAPCRDRLWEGSRERGGRWRSWDRAHQPSACAAAGAPHHPSLQPARSCPRVPRHGTGSAERCQQQWREHRGHPLCHQTQGPGWKCPTEDFSGLQHLHGPICAGRGWGQPGAEPPSQRAEQPRAREGEWGRSSPRCRCLLALLFTSSLLAP